MERIRKPFQGVINIVRFNWHFYVLSAILVVAIFFLRISPAQPFQYYLNILGFLIIAGTIISLLSSFYIYDLSVLYKFSWLDKSIQITNQKIINIHAGFDETSSLLHEKYPDSELAVFDFYDEEKHTEISIRRARNAYPPYPGTKEISTSSLPLPNNSVDDIFLILAAHEIRNDEERIIFFKELNRVLINSGKIIVTEHLRDLPNFLAYNFGFFHFLPKSTWQKTFEFANLKISHEIKITPFITTFLLEKNGAAS